MSVDTETATEMVLSEFLKKHIPSKVSVYTWHEQFDKNTECLRVIATRGNQQNSGSTTEMNVEVQGRNLPPETWSLVEKALGNSSTLIQRACTCASGCSQKKENSKYSEAIYGASSKLVDDGDLVRSINFSFTNPIPTLTEKE